MTEGVLAAVITGLISFIGMVVTTIISSSSSQKLMQYQIKEIKADFNDLRIKVEKHNNLVERMAIVEQKTSALHERLDRSQGGE